MNESRLPPLEVYVYGSWQTESSQRRIILFLALRNYFACVGMFLSDEIFISTKIVDVVID